MRKLFIEEPFYTRLNLYKHVFLLLVLGTVYNSRFGSSMSFSNELPVTVSVTESSLGLFVCYVHNCALC